MRTCRFCAVLARTCTPAPTVTAALRLQPWIVQQDSDVIELKSKLSAWGALIASRAMLFRAALMCTPSRGALSSGLAALAACAMWGVCGNALSATTPAPGSDAAPGLAPESAGFLQAAGRERDAETLQTRTRKGVCCCRATA